MNNNAKDDPGAIGTVEADLIFPAPALVGLADDLREIFRAPYPAGRDPVWCQQRQYIAALEKIALFCKHSGIGGDVAEKIAQLGIAFADAQKGIAPPIFQKKKSAAGGRVSDSYDVWSARTTAMLGLECYIAKNFEPEAAAKRASKKFPELARLSTRKARPGGKMQSGAGHDLAALLLSWLNRGKNISNAQAQSEFDEGLAFIARARSTGLGTDGDVLLGSAAQRAKGLPLKAESNS
jgi:hypothetical protein